MGDTFYCAHCDADFAELQLVDVELGGSMRTMRACPVCRRDVARQAQRRERPTFEVLKDCFFYPFQRDAAPVMVGLAIFWHLLTMFGGVASIIGGLLSTGVILAFLYLVVRTSAAGDDRIPMGADFSEIGDIVRPLVQFNLAFLLSFAPLLIVLALGGSLPAPVRAFLGVLLALAGVAYLPAAVIVAASTNGCLGAANPIPGVQLIQRIPGPYFVTVFALGLLLIVDLGIVVVAGAIESSLRLVPFVPGVLIKMLLLYAPLVAARMLGSLMHERKYELGFD